jgi:hypothetical protein
MELEDIPHYLRDLSTAISENRQLSLDDLNRQLTMLGWHHFELDDQTLQITLLVLLGEDDDKSRPERRLRPEDFLDPDGPALRSVRQQEGSDP